MVDSAEVVDAATATDPQPIATGRVVQLSVSPGGVPKRPIASARVGRFGVEGDVQAHLGIHGGPHRAVCLLGIEAIRRVAAEGHPIVPGSVGENLTTEGVELSRLEPGTRLRFSSGLELELSAPANPCDTIRGSFADGKSGRISIIKFPSDSRVYARVVSEGIVAAGDQFDVLPPLPDTHAQRHVLLERLEKHEVRFWEATWQAVAAGGADLRLLDLGDAWACAAPHLPGMNFNRAFGLRMMPNLRPVILEHFRSNGVAGWLVDVEPPAPGRVPAQLVSVLAIEPDRVVPGPTVSGLRIRRIGANEAAIWQAVLLEAFEIGGPEARAWLAAAPHIPAIPGMQCLLAEIDGEPVAAAGLYTRARIAGLGPGAVLPAYRGRGVHAALIADRAWRASELNCDLLTSQAERGGASERNMERMGLVRLHVRGNYAAPPDLAPQRSSTSDGGPSVR